MAIIGSLFLIHIAITRHDIILLLLHCMDSHFYIFAAEPAERDVSNTHVCNRDRKDMRKTFNAELVGHKQEKVHFHALFVGLHEELNCL